MKKLRMKVYQRELLEYSYIHTFKIRFINFGKKYILVHNVTCIYYAMVVLWHSMYYNANNKKFKLYEFTKSFRLQRRKT